MEPASLHRQFEVNTAGRDFVVGDLHGQQAMLDGLLRAVKFDDASDRLFSLGDLVDRGPDNDALVRRFETRPNYFAIRGNHEALVNAARDSDLFERVWERNGGLWGREVSTARLEEIRAFMDTLPYSIEISLADGRHIGLVHAEVQAGAHWQEMRDLEAGFEDTVDDGASTLAASALWGRQRHRITEFMAAQPGGAGLPVDERAALASRLAPVEGIDLVYVGHTIIADRRPLRVGNTVYVDTGAYLDNGRMTLVEPLHDRYWQVISGRRPKQVRGGPRPLPAAFVVPEAYAEARVAP